MAISYGSWVEQGVQTVLAPKVYWEDDGLSRQACCGATMGWLFTPNPPQEGVLTGTGTSTTQFLAVDGSRYGPGEWYHLHPIWMVRSAVARPLIVEDVPDQAVGWQFSGGPEYFDASLCTQYGESALWDSWFASGGLDTYNAWYDTQSLPVSGGRVKFPVNFRDEDENVPSHPVFYVGKPGGYEVHTDVYSGPYASFHPKPSDVGLSGSTTVMATEDRVNTSRGGWDCLVDVPIPEPVVDSLFGDIFVVSVRPHEMPPSSAERWQGYLSETEFPGENYIEMDVDQATYRFILTDSTGATPVTPGLSGKPLHSLTRLARRA